MTTRRGDAVAGGAGAREPRAPETVADGLALLAAANGEPLAELLRQIAVFRLAMDTDLTVGAAAAEAGATQVVADVLQGDRRELVAFQRQGERTLREGRGGAGAPGRHLRLGSACLLAATTALAGLGAGFALAGGVRHRSTRGAGGTEGIAVRRLAILQADAAGRPHPAELAADAAALHSSLLPLLPLARRDAHTARWLVRTLAAEELLLRAHPAGTVSAALASAEQLMSTVQAGAAATVHTALAGTAPQDRVTAAAATSPPAPSPSPTSRARRAADLVPPSPSAAGTPSAPGDATAASPPADGSAATPSATASLARQGAGQLASPRPAGASSAAGTGLVPGAARLP